jgi:hypothetical protein
VSKSTDTYDLENEALRLRVKKLEDTVLYLSNTLAMHGIINQTEASVARRMYDQGRRLDD